MQKITRSLLSLVEFLKINIFQHFRVVYHWFTFARVTFTSWSIMPPSSNQVSFCWALPVYYGYVGNNLTCQDLSELQFWYLLPSSSFVPFWSWCRFMLNLWSLEWDFWLLFWVFLSTWLESCGKISPNLSTISWVKNSSIFISKH